jgi:predicted  nucleic acid-binding Zn-ribbon protein
MRFAGLSYPPLREKIGYHYIMHLLMNPHKKISRLELFYIMNPIGNKENENRRDESLLDEGLNIKTSMKGKVWTDQKAKAEYQQIAEELQKARKEAEMMGDSQKVCKIDQEMDDLTAEIDSAKRAKKSAKSSSEIKRQRESVYKAINSAIHSLEKFAPELGHHLHNRIKAIGSEYVYSPQPPEPYWHF